MIGLAFDGGPGGWAIALGAGGLAALAWKLQRRTPLRLRALRCAAAGVLALAGAQPVLESLQARLTKPRLSIVVDQGLSMGAKDGGKTTRLERAVEWLEKHRAELEERSEPVLYAAAERGRRVRWEDLAALKPASAGFDLAAAFQDVSDGPPSSRLWLLSDGASDDAASVDAALSRWRSPVDALGVGPKKAARSLAFAELRTPDFTFLHARFPVTASVEASELAGTEVELRLWKGAALAGSAKLTVASPFEVLTATLTAEASSLGEERFRVEAVAAGSAGAGAREVAVSKEFGVQVIRQKYRIMYLAGRPSIEYSHLREQLRGDPNHELVSFVILRNPENVSPVSDNELSLIPFPAQEIFVQNLMQFDLFILENFAYWRFNLPVQYLDGLKRFVAQGGGLLVVGGSNAFTRGGYQGTPLEEILPVSLWQNPDDYQPGTFFPKLAAPENPLVRLADTPEAVAALWKSLPALDGFNRFQAVRPGATVLLAHPTEKTPQGQPLPIVSVREYGKGKVMVVGSDSTWRWRLGSGADWKLSAFYSRFWSRAVQYLSGSLELKKVRFAPLPDRMPPREPAVLTVHLFDDGFRPLSGADADLKVFWTSPGGKSSSVVPRERRPGVFDVELTGLAEGPHELRAVARYRGQAWGEDRARFTWHPRPPESALNRRRLQEAAGRSGGEYSDLDRVPVSAWLDRLPPVRRESEVLRRTNPWDSTAWLWLAAVLLTLEWLLRRRLGFA
ncbi:MAG: hypothetical protein HY925_12005 [Elusimicrobia bacterium]|nr:hypothetical protein [Elusimicrobiota bacterium]